MDFPAAALLFIALQCFSIATSEIPLSFWKKISRIKTLEEFRAMYPIDNGSSFAEATYKGLKVATPDTCSPRPTTFEVKQPNNPTDIFWPICISVDRCGGCCEGSSLLACMPIRTKVQKVQIMRLRQVHPDSDQFSSIRFEAYKIRKHLQCECRCRVRETDCIRKIHKYNEDSCSCMCKNDTSVKCVFPHQWNKKRCTCECPKVEVCRMGKIFNHALCKCQYNSEFSSANNKKKKITKLTTLLPEVMNRSETRQMVSTLTTKPKVVFTPQTQKTKAPCASHKCSTGLLTPKPKPLFTTPTQTAKAPCATHPCPALWKPVKLKNGKCSCGFSFG